MEKPCFLCFFYFQNVSRITCNVKSADSALFRSVYPCTWKITVFSDPPKSSGFLIFWFKKNTKKTVFFGRFLDPLF